MNWKQKLLSLRDKAEMLMYEDDINFEIRLPQSHWL